MGSDFRHTSVLLQEAVDGLNVRDGKWYVDATAGGGGHTEEILDRGGRVIAIDQDEDAISHLRMRFESDENVKVAYGNFSDISEIAHKVGPEIAGVIFDLGLSSYHIDASNRGFSFMRDENLDMRMDKNGTITAKDIINTWRKEDLYELFTTYGEEPYAQQIIDDIFRARRIRPIQRTSELVEIIKRSSKEKRIHPATRVFQALRIAVNRELDVLGMGLRGALEILEKKGRIVVISFHSLEDRITKQFMEEAEREGLGTVLVKKPVTAGFGEIRTNPRSRSAKMRVFEKI